MGADQLRLDLKLRQRGIKPREMAPSFDPQGRRLAYRVTHSSSQGPAFHERFDTSAKALARARETSGVVSKWMGGKWVIAGGPLAAKKKAAKKKAAKKKITGMRRVVLAVLVNASSERNPGNGAHFFASTEKRALNELVKAKLAKITIKDGAHWWALPTAAGVRAYNEG